MLAAVLSAGLMVTTGAAAQEEEVGSTTAAVCCGSECCNISGSCRGRGEMNPANSCQQCDPGNSQSSWSNIPGCTPGGTDAGTGGGDDGGCSATSMTPADALPLGLAAFFGLLGFARRRR